MNDQHRATPEQWQAIKANSHLPTRSTILELLHRIKALEAAATTANPNYPEIPDSSLLSQVAAVIDNGAACDREPERVARDVIRAVAAWLREQGYGHGWATVTVEEEAER